MDGSTASLNLPFFNCHKISTGMNKSAATSLDQSNQRNYVSRTNVDPYSLHEH